MGRSSKTRPPFRFDPQSLDATLATIVGEIKAHREQVIVRFDAQDAELAAIREQVTKTNGRTSSLERWRDSVKVRLALIAGLISAGVAFLAWLIPLVVQVFSR